MGSGGMNQTGVVELEKQDLEIFANHFNGENFICQSQFCGLYHGKIPQGWKGLEARDVTVKLWLKAEDVQEKHVDRLSHSQNVAKFNFEVDFLKSDKATSCPYFPRLIAHARSDDSEFLGVVYDLQSSNTLRHFFDKAEFKWLERIKIAVGLAHLLRHLHDQPMYLVRELDAAHIMLDKDWKPVLFNYFLLVDGPMDLEGGQIVSGSYYYYCPAFGMTDGKRRVLRCHAFAIYPLKLKSQRIKIKKSFLEKLCLSKSRYHVEESLESRDRLEVSYVDNSLDDDPYFSDDDGLKISELARLCVEFRSEFRPDMKEVVECLENLQVVRQNAEMFKP